MTMVCADGLSWLFVLEICVDGLLLRSAFEVYANGAIADAYDFYS